ncbi:MAG: hypothetical protein IJG13_05215, partial [Kiritimatiellae bacterium]|nr:hypothetical protein [Kiritimatiellia bacterium]
KGQLADIAAEMGLARDPAVLPEWRTTGYITVLRRNWHLLPYEQLMKLLGKTRGELYFSLMEDDFLWVKLGCVKPYCEPLEYDEKSVASTRAARLRIAAALKEEGLDPAAPEEPRFSFVKEIASVSKGQAPGAVPDESPFGFRLIFSYFADYGDPLGDPEISSYPEGLLQKLSASGVNAVWLHTVLRTLAKDPKYPEFGEGSEKRIANLRKLVARAAKYGRQVFLYMNEPRALPTSFFEVNDERRGFKGVPGGGQFAMCTSCPEVRRWVRDSLKQVFSQVPGLGGIFTITMSENLTNCASRGGRERCPRCKGRAIGDIVAEINRAMIEGMAAGNPKAEALVWNWQWPKPEEAAIVSALPKDNCRLMAVSENAMKICRGGVNVVENDYSISIVGPGENARRFWGYAKGRGIPPVAKVQAGNSWELSSFPDIPVMDLVAQHAVNLANEGVDGVMLSWSLGCCPSPNLRVYKELRRGETTKDAVLDRMAAELYGAKAKEARAAWTAFSEGFANYPFSCSTIYVGPHQWGPANPLYARNTGWRATMVGIPYDNLDGWRSNYPRETYAQLIGKVADGFAEGCRLMDGVASERELNMFRAEQMHFASCRDQALFVMARDKGDGEGMKRCAKAELERAKAYWPLVRADSRIGYESSNHYFFVPRDVLEKVLSCRAAIAAADGQSVAGPSPRRGTDFTLYNVMPYSPGREAQSAADCVEYMARTGCDLVLYSLTLHPEGKPAMEKVERYVASYRALKRQLEGSGVRLGVRVQAIIGHWPRVDKDIEDWTRTVNIKGEKVRFCPDDPGFAKYIDETFRLLAKENPAFILTDDDVRAYSHDAECFCARHVAEFNRRRGTNYTEKELREKVASASKDDPDYKEFLAMQRDMMNRLVKRFRAAIDSANVKVPAGICVAGEETFLVPPMARAIAAKGQTPVMRVATGCYCERFGTRLASNLMRTLGFAEYYRGSGIEILDEADTCPQNLWSKSALSFFTHLEVAAFLGYKGAKTWYVNGHRGGVPITRAYTDVLAENSGLLDAIARESASSAGAEGVAIPCFSRFPRWHVGGLHAEMFIDGGTLAEEVLIPFGIPVRAEKDFSSDGIYVVSRKLEVDRFTDADLDRVFSHKVLVSGEAAVALTARGRRDLIGLSAEKRKFRYNSERDVATGAGIGSVAPTDNLPFFSELAEGAETLSVLGFTPYRGSPVFEFAAPGSVLWRNALGGTVATCAYHTDMGVLHKFSETRKAQLVRMFDRLAGKPLAFVCGNDQDVLVMTRRRADGGSNVFVANLNSEPIRSVRLRVPSAASVSVLAPNGTWRPVEFSRDGEWVAIDEGLAFYQAKVFRVGR